MVGAKLRTATFYGTDLTKADLSNADVRWTDFSGATLSGAIIQNVTRDKTTKGLDGYDKSDHDLKIYRDLWDYDQLSERFVEWFEDEYPEGIEACEPE